ncbi:MAG: MBL fold metallo-hydrolase [Haloarculaceae archaeon]
MQRISLENVDLEGANNAYLIDTDETTVLVDTGESAREQTLRAALDDEGVSFADVDEVFLTHWHPDHSGLAGLIQEESGATVRIHERDAPLARHDDAAWSEFSEIQQSRLEAWGVPEAKRQQLFDHRAEADITERASLSSVASFADGETFAVGDHVLRVVHTPGHTAGSVCFALDDGTGTPGDVVTGDTLLPKYTPNVGGTDVRLEQPLDQYLTALYDIAAADYARAWPGHRAPIEDPARRAHEIIAHHEQRAGRILGILDRLGPADVWTISTELFGQLEEFHILVGAGEAYAHLAHLEEQGDVERVDGAYRLVDEVRDAVDGDDDTWSLSVSDDPSPGR